MLPTTFLGIKFMIFLFLARRQTRPPPGWSILAAARPPSVLAIPELVPAAQRYFSQSLSFSSTRSYRLAQSRYNRFCHQFSLAPFPPNELMRHCSATFLAQKGLRLQTIKCYLSALRHAQIANGFPDPRIGLDHPRLECILRGIKRSQATSSSVPNCTRLPITPDILRLIHSYLPQTPT